MKRPISYIMSLSALLTVLLLNQLHANSSSNAVTCHAAFVSSIAGSKIYFLDNSTGTSGGVNYMWDFGDSEASYLQNPVHDYDATGTYKVCLTINDATGCTSTTCQQITISSPAHCQASFAFLLDASTNQYSFTNTSTGTSANTVYTWDFGDGSFSATENPTHTYGQPGPYNVCLYINDRATACSSYICNPVNFTHTDKHFNSLHGETAALSQHKTDAQANKIQNITINPNPVNSFSTIQYELMEDAIVTIGVYDLLGNKIYQINSENESKGQHDHIINSDLLHSGIYTIKMQACNEFTSTRISVLK